MILSESRTQVRTIGTGESKDPSLYPAQWIQIPSESQNVPSRVRHGEGSHWDEVGRVEGSSA